MPNHITNRLVISGDNSEIKKMFEYINGGIDENGQQILIDFNKIIPMPKELDIPSSSDYERGYDVYMALEHGDYRRIDKMLAYPWVQQEGIATRKQMTDYLLKNDLEAFEKGKQYYENIQKYGAPTWYEWCNSNWNTKWPAYEQEQIDSNTIQFLTAWSGVPDLLCVLSEKFRELSFDYEYADEDYGHNVGHFVIENGSFIEEHIPDGGSKEALEIAARLLGEYENEEDYEEETEEL